MDTNPTELCVEEITQHLITADTVFVPADSQVAYLWEDELGVLISKLGLNTKFESPDEELAGYNPLTSVAFGVEDPIGGSPAHPDHYGGDWYRVRLPRIRDKSGRDFIHLPYPGALALAACEHFDIIPPPGLSAEPAEPAAAHVSAELHAHHADTAASLTGASHQVNSLTEAIEWADTAATAAARRSLPEAVAAIGRSAAAPDGRDIGPAAVVLLPAARCGSCDSGRPPARRLDKGHWTCEKCDTPNAPHPIAAVALAAADLDRDPGDAQQIRVPHPDVVEALTGLGTEAHIARRRASAAASAWDLAARIGTELHQLARHDDRCTGAQLLERWVHETVQGTLSHADDALLVYTDHRWAGIDNISTVRSMQPIVAWNTDHHYLQIAYAALDPGRLTCDPHNVTRIDAESAQHPGSVVAVAHAAAGALRAQLPAAESSALYCVSWDPDATAQLRCDIVEPDAHRLEFPLRPARDQPLGTIRTPGPGPAAQRWADSALHQPRSPSVATL